MKRFSKGDRVRIDIPDVDDPDYESFHGEEGTVSNVITDTAGTTSGDARDNILYRVELDDGTTMDFRWRDVRPP